MAGSEEDTSRGSIVSTECIYELFEHCFKTPYKASANDRKVSYNEYLFNTRLENITLGGHYSEKVPSSAWQGL